MQGEGILPAWRPLQYDTRLKRLLFVIYYYSAHLLYKLYY